MNRRKIWYSLFILLIIGSCKKDDSIPLANLKSDKIVSDTTSFTVNEAKTWLLNEHQGEQQSVNSTSTFNLKILSIDWSQMRAIHGRQSNRLLVHLPGRPLVDSVLQGYRKLLLKKDSSGQISAQILEIIPDPLYIQRNKSAQRKDFSGKLFIYDQTYHLSRGFIYNSGKIIGEIKPSHAPVGGMHTNQVQVIKNCSWHDANYVDAEGVITIYSEKVCTFDTYDDGMDMPVTEHPNTSTDYFGGGGGGGGGAGSAPPVSNLPDEGKPSIDPKEYVKCFGNVPDAGATMKVTVYVQQPFPGTTFNIGPNSVGHVAIGLTKINGSQVVTQVVGFYPNASGLDKINAPSKIIDNGTMAYNISITYEVGAGQFQSIANFIGNPPATYDLVNFNCTNFVFTAVRAGGIDLPDPLTRVGPQAGPSTSYAMTPAGLGDSISKLGDKPNIQSNGGTMPASSGPCK